MKAFRALPALCAALVLAACGTQPAAVTPKADGTQPTDPVAVGSTAHVLEARKAAGIADCPESDPTVPARADGLPDVTLECLGADSRVRLAGLRGTPMVINVWAQWCGPCRTEAPFLTEASELAGDRVLFLGIDYVDPRPELAVAFADEAGWRYPQLVDAEKHTAPGLKIVGPPHTVFVTAEGRIAHLHPGPVTSTAELTGLIREHLEVAP